MATPYEFANVTIAGTTLDPQGGEICTINGKLCYFEPGWRFQGTDTTYSADGLWVPFGFAGGNVQAVYKGGRTTGAVPNSQWSWVDVKTNGGAISQSGDETRFVTDAINKESYTYVTPSLNTSAKYLVYAHIKCLASTVNDEKGIDFDDKNTALFQLTVADGATAGDFRWNNNAASDLAYVNGTDWLKVLLLIDTNVSLAELWLYHTMQCINSADIAGFGASGGSIKISVGVQNPSANGTGTVYIQDYPAIAIIDCAIEP